MFTYNKYTIFFYKVNSFSWFYGSLPYGYITYLLDISKLEVKLYVTSLISIYPKGKLNGVASIYHDWCIGNKQRPQLAVFVVCSILV